MKRLWLTMGLLAFSAGLQAQIFDTRAEVPFDFWLGQKLMPAGTYSISHFGTGAVLLQGGKDSKDGAIFLGETLSSRERHAEPTLEFTRYGNVYFLSKIFPYHREGLGVPKSAKEKELASRGNPSRTDIALSTK